MCGIVAYTGKRRAAPVLYEGLCNLEYRGYDSAGIAVLNGQYLSCIRREGKIAGIADAKNLPGNCGIGHTRWATHGGAEKKNAHPHVCGKFAIVHNGIIENYAAIKSNLSDMGHIFSSDTDSEVVAHLLSERYKENGDFLQAVKETVGKLKGSFALAVLCTDFPETVVCVKQKSPLIVGMDDTGAYAASDITALGDCKKIRVLSDGEIAVLKGAAVRFFSFSLRPFSTKFLQNTLLKTEKVDKNGYAHFMLKEIHQGPESIARTVRHFNRAAATALKDKMPKFSHIYIIACGTAYHSALTGAAVLEQSLKIPVSAELAGEFCYRRPLLGKDSLVIAVSQSGETADTLAAVKLVRKKGAALAVITNVGYSSLAGLGDYLFLTQAGVEIGVAATKTYAAQLTEFYLLSAFLAGKSYASLSRIPAVCNRMLREEERLKTVAEKLADSKAVYFLGRGLDYPSALEGSLKLREVSYIAGAGYAAGELKHGSIALMDQNAVVIAVSTQRALKEKTGNAVNEVSSRGATVYTITPFSDMGGGNQILLPPCPQKYYPLVTEIPLQLLAYYTAVHRGLNPDQPRNLAKSVTVE